MTKIRHRLVAAQKFRCHVSEIHREDSDVDYLHSTRSGDRESWLRNHSRSDINPEADGTCYKRSYYFDYFQNLLTDLGAFFKRRSDADTAAGIGISRYQHYTVDIIPWPFKLTGDFPGC